jgi:hypothetical protein
VRSDAKAPSAGSTTRGAAGLGRILRGALATRAPALGAAGSGAPSHPRPRARRGLPAALALVAGIALGAACLAPSASAATPEFLVQFGNNGAGAGQTVNPRGIAADPATGYVYVSENSNNRVSEFTSWGQFVKAWGWRVDASNPEPKLQTCTEATGCLAGSAGSGAGQFSSALGVAVDSSGDVWVVDAAFEHPRVQKFDPDGGPGEEAEFLLMIGKNVNAGTGEPNLCTNAGPPTDECQAAEEGNGEGGAFESSASGSFIAADSSDVVYVGDRDRIQEFNASGEFQSEIALPGYGQVKSLALDPAGNIYTSKNGTSAVVKRNSSGAEICTLEDEVEGEAVPKAPRALATDSDGNVYVVDERVSGESEVQQYGDCEELLASFGRGDFEGFSSGAIAVGLLGDGSGDPGDVYVANSRPGTSYVRAYGPLPEFEPPPDNPPQIEEQYVTSVGSAGATVEAVIRPNFWSTDYYVQYGTAACVEGGWGAPCVQSAPAPPGATIPDVLGSSTVAVTLGGLAEHTAYRYRFVAESEAPTEGGPVFGKGGTPGSEGEAGSFATFASPAPEAGCPNDALRTGPSAFLPDCRAFEMVSPPDKEGGEVAVPGPAGGNVPSQLQEAASSGEAVTYASATAFGDDPESSPGASQYISRRSAGGWASENPNPRFEEGFTKNPFVGFSADLSRAAVRAVQPTLTGDAAQGFQDLYGRDNAGGLLTAITTEANRPEISVSKTNYCVSYGGASADFDHVAFAAKGALLESDPVANGFNLYEWSRQPTNGRQTLTVDASGGDYELTLTSRGLGAHSETTAPITATATAGKVRSSLEALPGIGAGDVAVTGGPGDAGGTQPYTIAFAGTLAGTYVPTLGTTDLSLSGGAAEATVATVEPGGHLRLLSVLPDGSVAPANILTRIGALAGLPNEFCSRNRTRIRHAVSADGSRVFWTYASASEANENQIVLVLAGGGKFTLSYEGEATGELDFNATAGEVEAELNALGTINAEGGSVTVAGGPGGSPTTPYLVSFDGGPLAGTNVEQLEATFIGAGFANVSTIPSAAYGGAYQSEPGVFTKNPLLARVDGAETVQLDAVQVGANQGGSEKFSGLFPKGGEGEYQDASSDGSKVFFADPLKLTADSAGGDLYLYDFDQPEGSRLIDLTPDALTPGSEAAGVQGVIGTSAAGDYVYFVATAELDGGATAGANNLYAWHEGDGVRFIATLGSGSPDNGDWASNPEAQTARVASGGRHVAFVSKSAALADSVAGFDNTDQGTGNPATEVYLYDFGADALRCASCNPSGARPTGSATLPTWTTPYEQPRYLSDGGGRLFFETLDALAPRDTNGERDVYQWEAPGSGRCSAASRSFSAQDGGCVDLVSSGGSDNASYFVDASADGRDVFVSTQQRLFPTDKDERYDVYDARVGGGFPYMAPAAECEGDEQCHPGGTQAGAGAAAGSASFQGAGNLHPRQSCKAAARKAKKLSRRAKKLRRHANQAKRAGKSGLAKRRMRKSTRLAKQARKKSKSAKRCRRANRRAAR